MGIQIPHRGVILKQKFRVCGQFHYGYVILIRCSKIEMSQLKRCSAFNYGRRME